MSRCQPEEQSFNYARKISSGDLLYSIVSIVNNVVFYT